MNAARRKQWARASACGVAVLGCIALAGPAQAKPAPENTGTPPRVNMEQLLRAAQLDAYRPAGETTKGAAKDVKRVQRALKRKGFSVAVDGNFGGQTLNAYSGWQKRIGASGIGANGLPGVTSLTQLGQGRFTVTHPVSVGPIVVQPNGTSRLNTRTNRMKKAAARLIHCKMVVTQGSYNSSVDASAATHSGGGAIDISVKSGCGKRHVRTVRALRKVGFAAWYRTTSQGFDSNHIHAIAISDPDMSTPVSHPGGFTSMHQVVGYARKQDGLNSPAFGQPMTRKLVTWEQYKRSRR